MSEEVRNTAEYSEQPQAEPAAPQEAPSQAPRLEELERRLSEKDQAYTELENQLKRLAADFDNYRKRAGSERENLIKFAGERILERFLDVLDNFERALQTGEKATDPQQVLIGVSLIYRQLQDFLSKEGVASMEPEGQPFDPNQHEAVVQGEVTDLPDQTVLEVFRKGYLLNGRVLRHAMVKVAHNPTMTADSAASPPTDFNQTP